MLNPYVSEYVKVVNLGDGEFRTVAAMEIPVNSIVEVCPVRVLTKREALFLIKNVSNINNSILADESVMDKEFKIFSELGEFELEKKLDSGLISNEDYVKILRSKINPTALLESKSHALILGNGFLYRRSDSPNLVCEYHSQDKVCLFRSAKLIQTGLELTYYMG